MAKSNKQCKGCRYSGRLGSDICCDYILITGNRRPCAPEECTVRERKTRGRKKKVKSPWGLD